MTPFKTLVAAAFVASIGAGTAFADPPDCPPGQAKKGNCVLWYDDGYWRDYRDEQRAYDEGFRDGRREGRAEVRWEIGRALPRDVDYVVVRDYDRYHLRPPPRGHYYAEVDGRILLIQATTQLVLDALSRR
jgi:Ni/Co efflux regulator RcnB